MTNEKQVKARYPSVSFFTQGCRLNASETSVLERSFSSKGYAVVAFSEPADIVVVNTCTVTENGDKDTRKLVHKINRINPEARIALIGCQAQLLKGQLLDLKNVQWVIGNQNKLSLVEFISDYANVNLVDAEKIKPDPFSIQVFAEKQMSRTRANLKIQDGCNFYCAFCTIPFARGQARSRDFRNLIAEATASIEAGHQELVLTGVNMGTYEDSGFKFLDVVRALLQIDGLRRLRISSIEPTTIPIELLDLAQNSSVLCDHYHIPLQSGTDSTLENMRRVYSRAFFENLLGEIRRRQPLACIGTDVIVGFPGESEEDFEDTYAFIESSHLNYCHVFSYSERKMAHSRKFDGQVSKAVIDTRSNRLRELSAKMKNRYLSQFVGETVEVLFEQEKRGYWTGLSSNYLKVSVASAETLKNQFKRVRIVRLESEKLIGESV